jgi:hypothetical protein
MHFISDSKNVPCSRKCGLERLHATLGRAARIRGGVAPAHIDFVPRPNTVASRAQIPFFSFTCSRDRVNGKLAKW